LVTKIPETLIGILYTLSAIISLVLLWVVPRAITRWGTRPIILSLVGGNLIYLALFIFSHNVFLIAAAFVLFLAHNTSLFFCFDILIESWSSDRVQGTVRGIYLTCMNLGFMMGPFLGGFITDRVGFRGLYIFAWILLIPLVIFFTSILPTVHVVHHSKTYFLKSIRTFIRNKNLGSVLLINFILQFFYAWMVIYSTVFLHEVRGISWDVLGLMFTIMLSAFVLLQYGLGKITDLFHIEKVLMVLGLLIMGIATLGITQAPFMSITMITLVLFGTRVGASIIEVVTESYFFKHVHADDVGTIGFFRNMYPLAYVLAPMIASAILTRAPLWTLFTILGCGCIAAVLIVVQMNKTTS
jgi:MFS family permease